VENDMVIPATEPRVGTLVPPVAYSDRPDVVDQLGLEPGDAADVLTAITWAQEFLGSPHPELGRSGPVCPFIRHALQEELLYVTSRTDDTCDSDDLRSALRDAEVRFADLRAATSPELRRLVTMLVVLPRIDRGSSTELDRLHAELKDGFVSNGLMLGQFHPQCEAPGLWRTDFRPLKGPIPLLAIREMVSSDLPFLIGTPDHANAYFERFAKGIPAHTRRFLVDRLVVNVSESAGT
jgi:hypothetical protein